MDREPEIQNKEPDSAPVEPRAKRDSLWKKAFRKFFRDKFGIASLVVVGIYFLIAVGVWLDVIGTNWSATTDASFAPPSSEHWFGTNINGQDIRDRALYGTRVAFEVGLVVALLATTIGGVLGCIAGYFNRTIIDEVIMWLYGCLDSIPFYLFVAAVAFVLQGNPYAMHIAMICTFWSSTCRIVRGEVIKIRNLEYVEAARAVGVKPLTIVFKHVFPNTLHILLVQATITFVGAIKSEVILSFLGLGVKNSVSWGIMLSEASSEVSGGIFYNFYTASIFLFILVIAFNIFADSLQDALDPKKVSV
ncbi:MAG: ABC transporter permease [Puniceicoccaceae bacterium]